MMDPNDIRWCPACRAESLDGEERFCKRCCKVFDKMFPDEDWHSMETEDLVEHYACGADSVYIDENEEEGIPPVADVNAPKKEAGKKNFLEEYWAILIPVAMIVIGLLILIALR